MSNYLDTHLPHHPSWWIRFIESISNWSGWCWIIGCRMDGFSAEDSAINFYCTRCGREENNE